LEKKEDAARAGDNSIKEEGESSPGSGAGQKLEARLRVPPSVIQRSGCTAPFADQGEAAT